MVGGQPAGGPLASRQLAGGQLAGRQLSGVQLSGGQLACEQLSGGKLGGRQLAGGQLAGSFPGLFILSSSKLIGQETLLLLTDSKPPSRSALQLGHFFVWTGSRSLFNDWQ